MSELRFATEKRVADEPQSSWPSLIAAIRRYADAQTPECAEELREWADLLEGIRLLKRL